MGPSFDDAHDVVFFRRHAQRMPGREFLDACPTKVRATMRVVLSEVAAAPPKRRCLVASMAGGISVRQRRRRVWTVR
jgi:hypothetical protein